MAAMAAARLGRIEDINSACMRAAETYVRTLAGRGELTLPTLTGRAWPRFVVRLDDTLETSERDEVLDGLARHDIEACTATDTASTAGDTCPRAMAMAPRLLALPLHAQLSTADATLVAQTLELMLQRATFQRD
jgi:dTDP-4-amino-4,6-dideoxygalactose transaminase